MKCFYHSADLDGHCAGEIVRHYFESTGVKIQMIGIDYQDPFPMDIIKPGDGVVMVDFSIQPFSQMNELIDKANLLWIDHHVSAIKAWKEAGAPEIEGIRDTGMAGCEMAWEWFYSPKKMPGAVHYLGRYDVWDLQPGVMAFQYGMRAVQQHHPGAPVWNSLLWEKNTDCTWFIDRGEAILQYLSSDNAAYLKNCSFEVQWEGYRCLCVNRAMISSDFFKSVPGVADILIGFSFGPSGWRTELRSGHNGVDVSAIAVKHGGGGHKGAAGFITKEGLPPYLKGKINA